MKRHGYLRIREEIELGLPGLVVWAYGKSGRYLGRVEINAAGLAAFTGKKGKKRLGNMSWETLFKRLDKRQK
jgi:hypothetical protein